MNLLKTIWKRWVGIAHKIGNFQSRLLLTIFYFTLLLPFAAATTLFTDRMRKKKPPKSMWTDWVESYRTMAEGKSQH